MTKKKKKKLNEYRPVGIQKKILKFGQVKKKKKKKLIRQKLTP